MPPRYILLGLLLTALTSVSSGLLLLRGLRVRLHRLEHYVVAYLCGAAVLSLLVFAMAAAHLVYKGVFVAVGVLVVAVCLYTRAWRQAGPPAAALPRAWQILFVAVYAIFGCIYFIYAMAPEHSADGMSYHLGVVARYYRERGFVPWTENMYANLPLGLELLFLFAYAFGRHSAGALVHWTFLMVLPLAVLCHARRTGFTRPGVFAAVLVLTSPVIARDGTFAYNDTALAALIFGMFLVLEIWRAERQTELLICGGLLAGLAFAVKYTGALAIAWAITTVLLASRRARPALIVAGAAALVASPWLIRNAVYTGNPVAPFFNRWFPNPYFYADWERNYLEHLRNFGGLTGREVVTEPLVRGERAQGLAGPLFLLAPIGLWALRHAAGRWLAAAGVVFALPFTQNMGTRFLIPALPFWALCTGVALANARGALALLTVLQAVASWPAFTGYYCGEAAWRLEPQLPFDATLRNIPEDRYLAETEPQYIAARMLEELVPAGGRVFAFSPVAEAYTTRRVVVGYQSAFAVRIREMLWAATIPELHQLRVQEFRFPARVLDRMRLIQTATHPRETWSVSELRVFSRDRELPRDTRWRLRANPNPWEVQRAFDNSELTRWVSHTPLRPGCFVEVSFGRPESIDRVVVESTRDQYQAKLALETAGEGGPWVGIGREAIEIPRSAMVRSVRRAAVEEVKREGITHLLIETSDFKAEDFHMRTANWGIELVGERGNARLYKLK